MKRLVFTTHLICWVDFAFESIWSVCIFMFYLCVCMYLSFAEINAMCFILFCRFCILWLSFCVCVVGFNVLLNEIFFSQSFMRLMSLSNLYAFLKPKTLTFELSLSLSFVLGPAVSLFSLYTSNFSRTSHPHSLIHSCFARSSPISVYFQVIYTISRWIWNFLLFFIKKYTNCIRWLN